MRSSGSCEGEVLVVLRPLRWIRVSSPAVREGLYCCTGEKFIDEDGEQAPRLRDIDFRHDAFERDRWALEDEEKIIEHYRQKDRQLNFQVRTADGTALLFAVIIAVCSSRRALSAVPAAWPVSLVSGLRFKAQHPATSRALRTISPLPPG
jgi:hypothetical protein